MTTAPQPEGPSAERAMFDALHNDGFKREEDWFVKNEGEEFMEQIHVDTIAMMARAALAAPEVPAPVAEPVARDAAWFALVMNAAAAIEDASNCLRDPDAKRAAEGAVKHYRDAANALYTSPPPAAQQ